MLAALNASQEQWVTEILESLSVEEKICQLMVPMCTPHATGDLSIAEWIQKWKFGGAHVFGGSAAEDVQTFISDIQEATQVPMLISGDLDKGGGDRLADGTLFQYQMAVGAANDDALAYGLGESIAVENVSVGYNWTFSPIVDVCGDIDYQRLSASISDDPQQVARLAVAQLKGIQDHKMAACAKHFPGDGFDERDQHICMLINPQTESEWMDNSGLPFRDAIAAGVESIMVASIGMPEIDDGGAGYLGGAVPAIISKTLVTDLLRTKLGFEGVIVTDALNMGGIAHCLPDHERYIQALEAGNDVLLFTLRPEKNVPFLVNCITSGRISIERINESVTRVLRMKARLGLHEAGATQRSKKPPLPIAACQQYAQELAQKSITVARDVDACIPFTFTSSDRIAHVIITNREQELDLSCFEQELCQQNGQTIAQLERFVNPNPESIYDEIASGRFTKVITSLYYPLQWGWCTTRAHGPFSRSLMTGYWLADENIESAFVSFVSPNHMYEFETMTPFLVTYGQSKHAQKVLAEILKGERIATGTVPLKPYVR